MQTRGSRVVIEFDWPEAEPPRGRLIDERGSVREFHGWLDLMSALESWREAVASSGGAT